MRQQGWNDFECVLFRYIEKFVFEFYLIYKVVMFFYLGKKLKGFDFWVIICFFYVILCILKLKIGGYNLNKQDQVENIICLSLSLNDNYDY